MWFKFSSDFLNHPFIQHIKDKCRARSPQAPRHILEALQMISSSMNFPITKRKYSSDIAWQVLIDDGILREVDGGFSAVAWLTEQGLFDKKRSPQAETPIDLSKVSVRENVMLTPNEIQSLKEKYALDVIENAYDLLSDYKTKTGRVYKSDYRALLSWALDASIKQKGTEQQNTSAQAQIAQHDDITPEQKARNIKRLNDLISTLP